MMSVRNDKKVAKYCEKLMVVCYKINVNYPCGYGTEV
jgi:hypothetical protein